MATVDLNHTFTDSLRWNTSARYYFSQANEHGSFILPGLNPPDPAPPVYQIFTLDMPSNPVREGAFDTNLAVSLRGLGGRHELLAGVSYDHTNFFSEMGFSGIPVGEEDLAHPTYNLSFGPETPASLFQTDRYQTTAVYGQDQATYGRLNLTGSVRYTKLDFRERQQATDKTYNHASGRFGGTFRVANGVALYAAYATAFRGAFGLVVQQAPKPETSQNVEGGLKLALSKAHLAGTIAIFNQIRNNVATADPTNFLYSVQTGQQRARGAEADLTWEPIRALSLLANYAYTEATVTKIRHPDRQPARTRAAQQRARRSTLSSGDWCRQGPVVRGWRNRVQRAPRHVAKHSIDAGLCGNRCTGRLRLRTPFQHRGFGSEPGRSSHLRSLRIFRVPRGDAESAAFCLRNVEDPPQQGVKRTRCESLQLRVRSFCSSS